MAEEQERAAAATAVGDGGTAIPVQENEPDVAKLRAALEAAQAELSETRDKFLRARADTDNIRRRAEIDVANAHKYAIERFAGEIVAVRDSLELARNVDINQERQTAVQKMHEGLDLTLKLMDDAFRKFGLTTLDPKGEKFDPGRHHAISVVESAEVPANHVVSVMQKGYLLQDRVLRPALVVVARAPAGDESSADTPGA